eukprot:111887_1
MSQNTIDSFNTGINNIASLCTTLNYPTILTVPHNVISAYKKVIAFTMELNTYSFKPVDEIKHILNTQHQIVDTTASGSVTASPLHYEIDHESDHESNHELQEETKSTKSCNTKTKVAEWIEIQHNIECIIQHWFHIYCNQYSSFVSAVIDIVLSLYTPSQPLKWSSIFNSNNKHNLCFEFSNNMCTVKRVGTVKFEEKYILPDIDEVTEGIHCWRVNIIMNSSEDKWIMFGVGQKRKYYDYSMDEAYGISNFGQYYPKPDFPSENNRMNCSLFQQYAMDIDILLNIDKCVLHICAVTNNEKMKNYVHLSVPSNLGWIPYFNIRALNVQLSIDKIPITLYGKESCNLKQLIDNCNENMEMDRINKLY